MGLAVPDLYFFVGLAYFLPDLYLYATPPQVIGPMREAASGRFHKGGPVSGRPPFADSLMDGCVVDGGAGDVG